MDTPHAHAELQAKLEAAGWSLARIKQSGNQFIAEGQNEAGEKASRNGNSPEMALANLVRFALRHNQIRQFSMAHTAAWGTNWLGRHDDIADAYRKLPVYDEKAVPAWKQLASESKAQADEIRKQIQVEHTAEPHPYPDANAMREDLHRNRHLLLSAANTDRHPVWSPQEVMDFRLVNDVLGHGQSGAQFTWRGANQAAQHHMPLVSPLARQALFMEQIAPAAHYKSYNHFGPQRIGLLPEFVNPIQEREGEHVFVPHGNLPQSQPPIQPVPQSQPGQWVDPAVAQLGTGAFPGTLSKTAAADSQQVLDANAGQDLQGLPGTVQVPGTGPLTFHSHGGIQQVANSYNQARGLGEHPTDYMKVQPEISARIADEYERMQHNPNDPEVRAAYDALKHETLAQYQHAKAAGYNFEFYPEGQDPYPNSPREAVLDLHHNKHMYVYPTLGAEGGYGTEDQSLQDHPLLEQTGEQWGGRPVTHNDMFRAIHDFYGHAKEGLGFRADGEDNAYRQHSAMFSPRAQRALAAETRGQNSWVNYGPHGQHNQTATNDTVYADQKAGLLPDWVTDPNLHAQGVTAALGDPQVLSFQVGDRVTERVTTHPDAQRNLGWPAATERHGVVIEVKHEGVNRDLLPPAPSAEAQGQQENDNFINEWIDPGALEGLQDDARGQWHEMNEQLPESAKEANYHVRWEDGSESWTSADHLYPANRSARTAGAPKGASVDPNRDWQPELPPGMQAPTVPSLLGPTGDPQGSPQPGPDHDYIERQHVEANAHKNIPKWQDPKTGELLPWWDDEVPTEIKNEAILNAFKVAILSPQKHLKWNAAHYQAIADMPAHTPAFKLFERIDQARREHNAALGHDPDAHRSYSKEVTLMAKRIAFAEGISNADAERKAKLKVQEMRVDAERTILKEAERNHIEVDPLSVEMWTHQMLDHWLKGTKPEHPTRRIVGPRGGEKVIKRAPSEISDPLKRMLKHPEAFPDRPDYRVAPKGRKPNKRRPVDLPDALAGWRVVGEDSFSFGLGDDLGKKVLHPDGSIAKDPTNAETDEVFYMLDNMDDAERLPLQAQINQWRENPPTLAQFTDWYSTKVVPAHIAWMKGIDSEFGPDKKHGLYVPPDLGKVNWLEVAADHGVEPTVELPWNDSQQNYYRNAARVASWVPAVGDKVMLRPEHTQNLGWTPDPRWQADMQDYPEGEIIEIYPASQRRDGTMGYPLFKVKGERINGLLVPQENLIPLETSQDTESAPPVPDTLPEHWTARTADQQGFDFSDAPTEAPARADILPTTEGYDGTEKGDSRPNAKYGMFYSSHLQAIAVLGQHINQLREAALQDIKKDGARGYHFRNTVMNLGVAGANAKVASFVWLLLAPTTSELGVLDTHMARVFKVPESALGKPKEYYKFERMQRTAKDATGYGDMPLGLYHWGLWDVARTPDQNGKPNHSDHQSLRPLDPLDWRKVKWDSSVAGGTVTPFQDPPHFAGARPLMQRVGQEFDERFKGQPQGRAPEIGLEPGQKGRIQLGGWTERTASVFFKHVVQPDAAHHTVELYHFGTGEKLAEMNVRPAEGQDLHAKPVYQGVNKMYPGRWVAEAPALHDYDHDHAESDPRLAVTEYAKRMYPGLEVADPSQHQGPGNVPAGWNTSDTPDQMDSLVRHAADEWDHPSAWEGQGDAEQYPETPADDFHDTWSGEEIKPGERFEAYSGHVLTIVSVQGGQIQTKYDHGAEVNYPYEAFERYIENGGFKKMPAIGNTVPTGWHEGDTPEQMQGLVHNASGTVSFRDLDASISEFLSKHPEKFTIEQLVEFVSMRLGLYEHAHPEWIQKVIARRLQSEWVPSGAVVPFEDGWRVAPDRIKIDDERGFDAYPEDIGQDGQSLAPYSWEITPMWKRMRQSPRHEGAQSMLRYPEVGEVDGDACSVAEDDNGVYVKTQRARSKSYPTLEDIPKAEKDFVATTASTRQVQAGFTLVEFMGEHFAMPN